LKDFEQAVHMIIAQLILKWQILSEFKNKLI